MPEKFNGDIKSYSIDYRKGKFQETKNYNVSKTVVAGVPSIRKVNVEDIKIKDPFSKTKTKKHKGVYIDAILPSRLNFYRFLFGCAVLILSIIGCIIFISISSNVDESVDAGALSSGNFSDFLSSVVMHDPDPFSSPEMADKQMVISSGIWRSIIKNGTQKYDKFDEKGCSLIPFNDVLASCEELFGDNYKLDKSQNLFGPFYTFSSNDEFFHISAISNKDSFLPYVENSCEEGDVLALKVGYISREDNYFKSGKDKSNEPSPIKYMKYNLKKNKDGKYYIFSIENIP